MSEQTCSNKQEIFENDEITELVNAVNILLETKGRGRPTLKESLERYKAIESIEIYLLKYKNDIKFNEKLPIYVITFLSQFNNETTIHSQLSNPASFYKLRKSYIKSLNTVYETNSIDTVQVIPAFPRPYLYLPWACYDMDAVQNSPALIPAYQNIYKQDINTLASFVNKDIYEELQDLVSKPIPPRYILTDRQHKNMTLYSDDDLQQLKQQCLHFCGINAKIKTSYDRRFKSTPFKQVERSVISCINKNKQIPISEALDVCNSILGIGTLYLETSLSNRLLLINRQGNPGTSGGRRMVRKDATPFKLYFAPKHIIGCIYSNDIECISPILTNPEPVVREVLNYNYNIFVGSVDKHLLKKMNANTLFSLYNLRDTYSQLDNDIYELKNDTNKNYKRSKVDTCTTADFGTSQDSYLIIHNRKEQEERKRNDIQLGEINWVICDNIKCRKWRRMSSSTIIRGKYVQKFLGKYILYNSILLNTLSADFIVVVERLQYQKIAQFLMIGLYYVYRVIYNLLQYQQIWVLLRLIDQVRCSILYIYYFIYYTYILFLQVRTLINYVNFILQIYTMIQNLK